MNPSNSKHQVRLPIYLSIAIVVGMILGINIGSNSLLDGDQSRRGVFSEVMTYIKNDYVDEVSDNELIDNAILATLENLDPHSSYITAENLKYNREQLEGNFEGVGIEYNIFKDTIYVVSPLSGGPSKRAGILAGDKIITVDDEVVAGTGINSMGVVERLRGEAGSKVTVTILRKGVEELLTFEITRDKIPQKSIDASYMIDDEIGYIKVNRFSATTFDEFKIALNHLKADGMNKLLLDLTGNPGGYMSMAVEICDELLADDALIVFTKGKESRHDQESKAHRKGSFETQPLVIMIDEGSASASEIVSGAVQDHDRGVIVGRRSFGKGLVQTSMPISDGSELRLTISRYYTPSGRCIQRDYGENQDDYHKDLLLRYETGEMYNKDKVAIHDSLKYRTAKGRTVYGGGGIIPDFYVPLDTTGASAYFNKLFTSNSIREYSFDYANENRGILEEKGFENFLTDFTVSEKMLKELKAIANDNGLVYDENQFNESKQKIKRNLKAQIARTIWDNNGFYPIYNQGNEIYLRALQLFDEAEKMTAEN